MADREDLDGLLERAQDLARGRLSAERYGHTLRVAQTAERLARLHGLDPRRARLAGLLHDAAREMPPERLLELAERWGVPVGPFERRNPKLLHGPVAAELVRRELGLSDEEVLRAIREHTTGSPGMGPLSLALYVADKIEPGRDYPSVKKLRELARADLREAALEALRRAVAYNERRGRKTHPQSLEWLREAERAAQRRVE